MVHFDFVCYFQMPENQSNEYSGPKSLIAKFNSYNKRPDFYPHL